MSPSWTRLAITCIIFVSLFYQHQCENVDGYEQNKLFIPPCIGLHRHHISFRPDSYCCDGKNKFCSPIKEECWRQCAILNPRPSSSKN
ncbi:hypothetical protein BRARA_B03493 [Brassica rapa]|uniref:Embryo surrounding factor 1 brassicaceae domain-containing protein n=1 Tax=Brassica campestris TaxID=3711 RepID=A0A398AIK0_BRACM|nr:hypothetical protein BRARA_B03493 [Brassica rapa]